MNTTTQLEEASVSQAINPGEKLAQLRQQQGYSIDYIASKLHLRTRIIEIIENNDFDLLPGPVFAKGYLRAYAKLLGISPEPYLSVYNEHFIPEKNPERTLWQQRKRETNRGHHFVRMFTVLFAVGVMIAVGIWWQSNREEDNSKFVDSSAVDLSLGQVPIPQKLKLTDISKMQSLLNSSLPMSQVEKQGE